MVLFGIALSTPSSLSHVLFSSYKAVITLLSFFAFLQHRSGFANALQHQSRSICPPVTFCKFPICVTSAVRNGINDRKVERDVIGTIMGRLFFTWFDPQLVGWVPAALLCTTLWKLKATSNFIHRQNWICCSHGKNRKDSRDDAGCQWCKNVSTWVHEVADRLHGGEIIAGTERGMK